MRAISDVEQALCGAAAEAACDIVEGDNVTVRAGKVRERPVVQRAAEHGFQAQRTVAKAINMSYTEKRAGKRCMLLVSCT